MSRAKLLMVSLGGTITMTRAAGGGIAPTLTAAELVAAVPGIEAVAEIETVSPRRLPSPSLGLDDLLAVAALLNERLAGELAGAVVIQGTDTIEETAFVLDLLVDSGKPVVVTGAMRGPEAAGADGPANLLAAARVAASKQAAGLGVLVCLNDQVHAARLVQKLHTALPSAFRSPGAGPLGLVAEGELRLALRCAPTPKLALPAGGAEAPVALLRMALGDDGRLLPALAGLGFRGAVIEGMGAGHVPGAMAQRVGDLLAQMPVVLCTRVAAGPVFTRTYNYPGSEIDLLGRGALPAGTLSGPKARLLLQLLLRGGLDRQELETRFRRYAEL